VEKDFVSISRIAWVANVVTVNVKLGVGSVADLVKLARERPGQLNYGSAGNGSPAHLAGAMLDVLAGIKTQHVPYKGAALAMTDVIGGQIQILITSPLVAMPHGRAGRIKVIATTAAKRDPLLPELPAVAETVTGYEIIQWWGIAVPARTPQGIVKRLHQEIVTALNVHEVREAMSRNGATSQPESPAEFATFIRAERNRIAGVGKQAGIALD
jgi:tripartite-type tricarboxylate transporter receptor subunit TctC